MQGLQSQGTVAKAFPAHSRLEPELKPGVRSHQDTRISGWKLAMKSQLLSTVQPSTPAMRASSLLGLLGRREKHSVMIAASLKNHMSLLVYEHLWYSPREIERGSGRWPGASPSILPTHKAVPGRAVSCCKLGRAFYSGFGVSVPRSKDSSWSAWISFVPQLRISVSATKSCFTVRCPRTELTSRYILMDGYGPADR